MNHAEWARRFEHLEYYERIDVLRRLLADYVGGRIAEKPFTKAFMDLRRDLTHPADLGHEVWTPDSDGYVRDIWRQLFTDFEDLVLSYVLSFNEDGTVSPMPLDPYEYDEYEFRRRILEERIPEFERNYGPVIPHPPDAVAIQLGYWPRCRVTRLWCGV